MNIFCFRDIHNELRAIPIDKVTISFGSDGSSCVLIELGCDQPNMWYPCVRDTKKLLEWMSRQYNGDILKEII